MIILFFPSSLPASQYFPPFLFALLTVLHIYYCAKLFFSVFIQDPCIPCIISGNAFRPSFLATQQTDHLILLDPTHILCSILNHLMHGFSLATRHIHVLHLTSIYFVFLDMFLLYCTFSVLSFHRTFSLDLTSCYHISLHQCPQNILMTFYMYCFSQGFTKQ